MGMKMTFVEHTTDKQQAWRKPSQQKPRRGVVSASSLSDCSMKKYNTAGTAEINASEDDVRNVVASLQRSVSAKEEAAWSSDKR